MVNSNSNTNDNTFVAPMGGVDIDNMTDEQVAEVLNGMTYNELIESYVEGLIYEKGMARLRKTLSKGSTLISTWHWSML